jgi:MFS transporter, DHA1 family, multidrug resistance protein
MTEETPKSSSGPDSVPAQPAEERHPVQNAHVAALLTAVVGIGALSIDMFLPSLPSIAAEFHASSATVQLAITLFMASYAAAQLAFGPLSDRYGRRPMLLAGLAVYVAGALLCLVSPNVEVLIAARILQGVGAGSGPVLGRAIVRDVYPRERAARVFALMGTAQALTPILAPILGGYLHEAFGWHSVFGVLSGFGVLFLGGCWWLVPESIRNRDSHALHPSRLIANAAGLVADPGFSGYVLVATLMFSGQFAFISGSAFVLIDLLHVRPDVYGLAFGFVAFGIMIGSTLAAQFTHRLGMVRVIFFGTVLGALSGTLMAAIALAGAMTPLGVIVPMFGFALAVGLVMPNAMAGAIGPFPHMAGLASAVLGFLMMTGSAAYSIAVSLFLDGTARPMATAVAVSGLAALACGIALVRLRK